MRIFAAALVGNSNAELKKPNLIPVFLGIALGLIARLAFKLNFSEICGLLAAVVIILNKRRASDY